MKTGIWEGCYKPHRWDKFRTKLSKTHLAKMDNMLLQNILIHLQEHGLLRRGGMVIDPMAGIGTTAMGWCAMHPDNQAITIELEDRFIQMQKANKVLAEDILGRDLNWTILKGDARSLSLVLQENQMQHDLVTITSPPYADAVTNAGEGPHSHEFWRWAKKKSGKWPIPNKEFRKLSRTWQREHEGYSPDPNNIGNLKDGPIALLSPPYLNITIMCYPARIRRMAKRGDWKGAVKLARRHDAYQVEKGNKFGITSEEVIIRKLKADLEAEAGTYSSSNTNIGNLKKETYLEAMARVYHEISRVCRVCVTVTKNPTRKGELRRLDLDTKALLEMVGYKIHSWMEGRLFKVVVRDNPDGTTTRVAEGRLSHFKRADFNKGNPVADHEDILIGVIPKRRAR